MLVVLTTYCVLNFPFVFHILYEVLINAYRIFMVIKLTVDTIFDRKNAAIKCSIYQYYCLRGCYCGRPVALMETIFTLWLFEFCFDYLACAVVAE